LKLASLHKGEIADRFAIVEMDEPDDCSKIAGVNGNDSDDVGILSSQLLELALLELVSRDGVKPDVGTNRECIKLTVVLSIFSINCVHVLIFELRNSGPTFLSLLLTLYNAVRQVVKLLDQCSFKRIVISGVICRLTRTNVTQMC